MARKPNRAPVTPKEPPELAGAEVVMNPETGAVLYARNADVQRDPASLTKLMTAYMVLKAVEEGKIKLDDQIKISAGAAQLGNNTFNVGHYNDRGEPVLPQNSRLTVREALTVMMTSSANGVAKALGEHMAPDKVNSKGKTIRGSERDFAREMTRVAQGELGMASSIFINASGLNNGGADQKSNLSTARDMAVLNQRIMKDFPQYEKLLSTHTASTRVILPDGQRAVKHSPTTNHFVRDFAEGGARARKEGFHMVGAQKTGFNRLTHGINLLATAENADGVRLTSIVLGGKDSDKRYAANLRNLRGSFARLDENPQYAAVYKHAEEKIFYAAVSPSAAFGEVERKGRARRSVDATVTAQADRQTPRGNFNRVGLRQQQRTTPPPAAEYQSALPAALTATLSIQQQIDMNALTALPDLVTVTADAAPRPDLRGGSLIKPVSFRMPGNE